MSNAEISSLSGRVAHSGALAGIERERINREQERERHSIDLRQTKDALRWIAERRKRYLEFLYHGTPKKNVGGILRFGLLPGWHHKVWFTDKPRGLMKNEAWIVVRPPPAGLVNSFDDYLRRLRTLKPGGRERRFLENFLVAYWRNDWKDWSDCIGGWFFTRTRVPPSLIVGVLLADNVWLFSRMH